MTTLQHFVFYIVLIIGFVACKSPAQPVDLQDEKLSSSSIKSIEVNSEILHYVEKGSGDPVIFIHGGLGDYRAWTSHIDTFSQNYHAIAYSRRYAYPNQQSFDTLLDYSHVIHSSDLNVFIKKLGLSNVNLVGHSYGALTALAGAVDDPSMINSLVLGEPPAFSVLSNNKKGMERFNHFLDNHIKPSAEAFREGKDVIGIERFLQGVMGDEFRVSGMPNIVKQRWMENLQEVRGQNITESLEPLDEEKIKAFDVPVLLLYGENSPVMLKEIITELHRLLPNSEVVEIKNSSHGLYFENQQATDKAIKSFWDNN